MPAPILPKPLAPTTKPITAVPISKPETYVIDPKWLIPMDGNRPVRLKK